MTPSDAFGVETTGLHVHFGRVRAIDDLSMRITGGTICGILGRNGAGKSTLLSTIAAFRRPTRGSIAVDGANPFENARLMSEICLIRETGDVENSTTVGQVLELGAALRPRWDGAFAERLVERFALPRGMKAGKLSRGQRAALAVTVGLASRAPLTMLDEPHLGMDAPSRYTFYEELLADYAEHPRTILLSTHHIDEVASILEDVVIIHRGRLLMHRSADELRAQGVELTGPTEAVDAMTEGLRTLSERQLGRTKSVVVFEPFDDDRARRAAAAGIDVGPIPLQDLFVHLTNDATQTGGTGDTSNETGS
jgi:ABC-2 type transport system ATP-binding protein